MRGSLVEISPGPEREVLKCDGNGLLDAGRREVPGKDLNACRIGAQLMVDEVVEPKRAIQAAGAE